MSIPANSLITMLIVLFILAITSIICVILRKKSPDGEYAQLRLKIQTWWGMILVLFLILLLNRGFFIVLSAFISFLALKEFFSIVPLRHTDRRVVFLAYLAIPLQYYWVYIAWYGMFVVFIPIYMFLFLPMRMVFSGETKGFIRAAGIIQWALMLTVFCISHIPYLLMLPVKNIGAGAIGLVLYLLFMIQLNDVGQYCWGKSLGKNKILPEVSPDKSLEGFIGGVTTTAICSTFIAPFLTPLSSVEGTLAGVLIAVAGFIGDIVVSAVKRDLQIKESGTLIPGQGGILDQFDSLTFAAPLFFHFLYYLAY